MDGYLTIHFQLMPVRLKTSVVDCFQAREENYWNVESKEEEISWKGRSHEYPLGVKKSGGWNTTTTLENTHLSCGE